MSTRRDTEGQGTEAHVIVAPGVISAAEGLDREERVTQAVAACGLRDAQLIWRSTSALMVTARDAALPAFTSACAALEAEGWSVLIRRSGGGLFPIGPGTLQFAMIARRDIPPHSIDTVYEALARPIVRTLRALGLDAEIGSVAGAVCDGRHDIAVGGRKIAGLAQRWRHAAGGPMCVIASASLIVDAHPDGLVDIANRFYMLAGSARRCRRDAMTSVAAQLSVQQPGWAYPDLTSAVRQRLCAELKMARPDAPPISAPAAASREYSSPA